MEYSLARVDAPAYMLCGRYQHMFVPAIGSSLSFVGLPWKIVPFPQFELQAKYIARYVAVSFSGGLLAAGNPQAAGNPVTAAG